MIISIGLKNNLYFLLSSFIETADLLTHISLASFLWDIGRTWRLTRVSTVCLKYVLLIFEENVKYHPTTLKTEMDRSY